MTSAIRPPAHLPVVLPLVCLACSLLATPAQASPWSDPLDLTIWVGYPVDATEAAALTTWLEQTNDRLWDSSDGQVRLGTVTLTASAAERDSADVWLLPFDGRAGVSTWHNGTSLEDATKHITMYQDSLSSNVMVHELGHYVFGLGEEYVEGATVGNNCAVGGRRIGACAGLSSAPTDQTWCVMQQNNSYSEFCVAGNHDPDVGNFDQVDLADFDCPEIGALADLDTTVADAYGAYWWCYDADFRCDKGFDAGTGNYEATDQSHFHHRIDLDNTTVPPTYTRVGLSCWETIAMNRVTVAAPAGNPVDAAPALPDQVDVDNQVDEADSVILIMDRSGSMGDANSGSVIEVCANGEDDDWDGTVDEAECAAPKMDFARAAARGFLELQAAAGTHQAALQSFAKDAAEDVALDTIQSKNCSLPANAGEQLCQLRTELDALVTNGRTDIEDALALAYGTFTGGAGVPGSKAVLLLTDGNHNEDGDPVDWIDDYDAANIKVFTIPVGPDVDQDVIGDITTATSGDMLAASQASDLPAIYAEIAGNLNGDGLLLPRTDAAVPAPGRSKLAQEMHGEGDSTDDEAVGLQVTAGAERLTVFLANTEEKVDQLDAAVVLYTPGGTQIAEAAPPPGVVFQRDPYYTFVTVANPEPGEWVVRMRSTGPGIQPFQMLASEANPQITFRAGANPGVLRVGDTALLTASTAYGRDLGGEGLAINYVVTAPDGTNSTGFLGYVPPMRLWAGRFGDLDQPGLYRYQMRVRWPPGPRSSPGRPISAAQRRRSTCRSSCDRTPGPSWSSAPTARARRTRTATATA